MSGNSEEVQFNGPFHYDLNFQVSSQVLKELVSSRIQLMGAPYFQIPRGARNLQVVSDREWVDWPSLEDGLTRRMNAHPDSGAALGTKQWGVLAYEGGTVFVRIEYLVDDYWWVECLMPGGMEKLRGMEGANRRRICSGPFAHPGQPIELVGYVGESCLV